METEELCNISISPLVTGPFAAQWSPDNQISIITEKGVHIFALEPSPMSLNPTVKFARSFIHSPDTLPGQTFLNKIDSLLWKLDREKIYSLLMEEAITPKLDSVNNMILRITKVAWSPKNMISPSQCILAVLTTAGAVELLHKVSNEWYSICNFSSLWLNIMQDEITLNLTKHKRSDNQNVMIIESIRQLQACSMTWSELFETKRTSFAYFSVAYRNGDISIWKIPRISNFTVHLQPIFINRVNLSITVKINVLCWITVTTNEHLVVVGYFDGQIYGIKLACSDNDIEIISTTKYMDSDKIAVNYFHVISQDESNVQILAAKGIFLLLLCINRTGILTSIQHLQMEQFNITDIISIAPQQFLVTTQDSHLFVVNTQSDDLLSIDVKSHLPRTCVQYLGLAQSPNKVMFVNVTSPSTMYDHLVMREPSVVHIFALKGAQWDPLSVINNSTNLGNVWDCMEALRIKAAKVEDLNMMLRPTMEKLGSLSLYSLQVNMWMTVMIHVYKMKKTIPNMDHIKQGKMSRALPLIFVHSACTYLDRVMKRKTLSENHILAISLLSKYLEAYLADEDNDKKNGDDIVHQRVRDILSATAPYPVRIEKCNLCGETIDELWWNITSCPSGHKLSRCTMTLLQITSLEYRVCLICGQIFHSCLEEIYEEPRCQFCDVPTLCNTYAFDVEESELYGRNLSQLQINAVEVPKEQEMEELPEERQRNTNTSDKYSVNDGDYDSDKITETWEEF